MKKRLAVRWSAANLPLAGESPAGASAVPPRAGVERVPLEAQAVTPGRTPERG